MNPTIAARLAALNITVEAVFIVLLAMFIVEAFRVIGRASDKSVKREPFSLGHYFSQVTNWLSLPLSFACSVFLLCVRDGFVDAIGLAIKDEAHFAIFYAGGVGLAGQTLLKLFLKMFLGAFGAYSKEPPAE